MGGRDKGVPKLNKLQSLIQKYSGALKLPSCNLQQFLQKKQKAKDRYDLVDGTLLSPTAIAESGELTRLFSALCELMSRMQVQDRRVLEHNLRSEETWVATKAAELAQRRKVAKTSKRSESLSSFASEKSAVRGKPQ